MTISNHHDVLTTPPPKAVLKPRDVNVTPTFTSPSKSSTTKTPNHAPKTPRSTAKKTPGRGLFSPTLPRKERKLGLEKRQQKFEQICKLRIDEEWGVDDFDCVRLLGSGGVANVYLAREIQSGHEVALKVQPANDSAFCEIDIHSQVSSNKRHPNILHMVDYFYSEERLGPQDDKLCEDDDPHFLCSILEVCEGGDLYERIDAHYCNVPEKLAAQYMMDAISALQQVHSEGVIHCDIKPANFLIDGNHKLKLADFGMAVRLQEKEVLGGSPAYMAPEHLLAWKHSDESLAHTTYDFDHRCDIYSLGVVMYEILMGYLPYEVKGVDNGDESESTTSDLAATLEGLEIEDECDDEDSDCGHPVLDLRRVKAATDEEPFCLDPPIFDGDLSEEAQDLILRFLEADPEKRITLEEAKTHAWFKARY